MCWGGGGEGRGGSGESMPGSPHTSVVANNVKVAVLLKGLDVANDVGMVQTGQNGHLHSPHVCTTPHMSLADGLAHTTEH